MARKCVNTVLYTNDLRRSRCIGTASLMKSWQRRRRSRTQLTAGGSGDGDDDISAQAVHSVRYGKSWVKTLSFAHSFHYVKKLIVPKLLSSHRMCVCAFPSSQSGHETKGEWTRRKLDALHPLCCIVESFANSFRGIILIENFHCSYRIL